jgi:FtsH-binding integral membrane protein
MLSTDSVWNRRDTLDEIISDRAYNLTIGGVLLWGFFLNALMVHYIPKQVVFELLSIGNGWAFYIAYLASTFIGTAIYIKSDNPAISFIGYHFLVVPLGIFVVAMVGISESAVVVRALMATASITGMMMMLGAAYPKFFLSIGRALGIAFLCTFVVEIGIVIFTGHSLGVFDGIMILIMAGYIGYDWARAQALPKTWDNAVDCAASLYVDIVILFIRLLSLMNRR